MTPYGQAFKQKLYGFFKRGKNETKNPGKPEKSLEPTELEKLVYESDITKDLSREVKEKIYGDLSCIPLRNDNVRKSDLSTLLEEAKKYETEGKSFKTGEAYWMAAGRTLPDDTVPLDDVLGFLENASKFCFMQGYPFSTIRDPAIKSIARQIAQAYLKDYKPPVEEKKSDISELTK